MFRRRFDFSIYNETKQIEFLFVFLSSIDRSIIVRRRWNFETNSLLVERHTIVRALRLTNRELKKENVLTQLRLLRFAVRRKPIKDKESEFQIFTGPHREKILKFILFYGI